MEQCHSQNSNGSFKKRLDEENGSANSIVGLTSLYHSPPGTRAFRDFWSDLLQRQRAIAVGVHRGKHFLEIVDFVVIDVLGDHLQGDLCVLLPDHQFSPGALLSRGSLR